MSWGEDRAREAAAPVLHKHSPFLVRGFVRRYLRGYFARNFHAVRLAQSEWTAPPLERPLVVFSNHPSWWDPLFYLFITETCFRGRRGFGPMDADALKQYGFLQRMGIFGVEQDSLQGAKQFLTVCRGILDDPGTLIWVTPEGTFTDVRVRPVRLEPGLAHLARHLKDAVLLPVAVEYTFWNESKPEALIHIGEWIESGPENDRPAAEWNDLLAVALARTMDELSAAAQARDSGRFDALISGRSGVGFFYDTWRRLKALVTGKPFSSAHEQNGPDGPKKDKP